MALKQRLEKLTSKRASVSEVVSLYNAKVTVSTGEAVSTSFVDAATAVWESVLKHGQLRRIIVAAEEHFGKKTPFDSVYKLEHVVRKSDKDFSRINWSLSALIDVVLNLGVAPTELSVSNLTGKSKGNKGQPYQSCHSNIVGHLSLAFGACRFARSRHKTQTKRDA